jgi:rod shape-determining protein MreD
MIHLLGLPILVILLVLQTAIVSQIPLLQGTADLILLALVAWALQKRVNSAWAWGITGGLLVGLVSAIPFPVYLTGYLMAVAIAVLLRQRIWNVPFLAMTIATLAGTLIIHGLTFLYFRLIDTNIGISNSINLVTLPSMLLNLILSIPFYLIFSDLARTLYPEPLEI